MAAVDHVKVGTDGAPCDLIVDAVDYEVRLLVAGAEKFSRCNSTKPSNPFRLAIGTTYVLRYNNNDGGSGVLRYRIVKAVPTAPPITVDQVDAEAIMGPTVIERVFVLDPG